MNYKRGVSLGLILSITLGTNVSALATTDDLFNIDKDSKDEKSALTQQLTERAFRNLKDSELLRVIVELDEDAVIERATEKGFKLDEMNEDELNGLQKKAMDHQQTIESKMESEGITYDMLNQFVNVINGFSVKTTLEEARKIENIKGVKSVTIANEYEKPKVQSDTFTQMTKAVDAWKLGFDGEGTVISIIDTGIDPSHRDMIVTNEDKTKLNEKQINDKIKENKLSGKYQTSKVPYGYNYMDQNDEILDLGPTASEHGMHVAGIAGANGDVENGGIKGTAPEAQLLDMKVFGNNPAMGSTFSDVIVKAIDDSVILGTDVINMSIGDTNAYIDDKDIEEIAITNASDNGVIVSVAAGNSSVFGKGYGDPFAENPDYSMVEVPGVTPKALQVGSIESNEVTNPVLDIVIDEKPYTFRYHCPAIDILNVMKGEKLDIVDYEKIINEKVNLDTAVNNKVVLLESNEDDELTKEIATLEGAGAKGVIAYNTKSMGNGIRNVTYNDSSTSIPVISVGNDVGMLIKENYESKDFSISFSGNTITTKNSEAGDFSDYTAWGMAPNLDLKPEITGVGGRVWSTGNNNNYRRMSGTSMATPNVSGGSAVVLGRINKEFDLKGYEKVLMGKNILMSTATLYSDDELYTSPRRQGAGIMNLLGATTTPAIVTESNTGVSKVVLKEIKDDKATFNMNVKNFSKEPVTYIINGTVQTDNIIKGEDGIIRSTLTSQKILDKKTKEMPISFSKNEVTVPAEGNVEFTASVDLSNVVLQSGGTIEENFVNGAFVEGFVVLTDKKDIKPELSLPYVGFKGDWGKVPIIDHSIYNKDGQSFYNNTGIASKTSSDADYKFIGLPFDKDEEVKEGFIDFSPNGDGVIDKITPIVSFLRHTRYLEVEVLDKDGNVLKTLDKSEKIKKDFYDEGYDTYFKTLENATWDGKVEGKVVEDGTYIYRIKSKVNFENAQWQNYDFKVNVDTVAPEINKVSFDEKAKSLTVTATDNLDDHVYAYYLYTPMAEEPMANDDGIFDMTELMKQGYSDKDCTVKVVDYAGNSTKYNVGEPAGAKDGDKVAPIVLIESPQFGDLLSTSKVEVKGIIKDQSAIGEFKIQGKDVPFTYDDEQKCWVFSHMLELEDGVQDIIITSKDAAGNELSFKHTVNVDTKVPVIEIQDTPITTTKDKINLKGKISENSTALRVYINDNLIEKVGDEDLLFNKDNPTIYDLNYEYKLKDGENHIVVKAVDQAQNTSKSEIVVNKVDSMNTDLIKVSGKDRFETAVEVSKKGWDKSNYAVLANGIAYVDSLVSAPLAASYDAPILLTENNKLNECTADELERLGAKTIFVIGGTSVISNDVVAEMSKMGMQIVRLGGEDRYETSLLVAKYINRQKEINTIYVSGGTAIADAVTISSKAAKDGEPIILVKKENVTKDTLQWIKKQEINNAYIIGGVSAISENVMKELGEVIETDISGNRVAGKDRYATNAAVMCKFFKTELENVMVTESIKLVDALVVAPYAAKTNAPIVITSNSLSKEQKDVLDKSIGKHVVQIGGQVNKDVTQDMIKRLSKEK